MRDLFHSYSPGPTIATNKSPLPGLSRHCGQISCMYLFLTFLLALSLGRKVLPSTLGLGHNPYPVGPMLAYIYLPTLISSGTEEMCRKCVINNNKNGKHMVLVVCQALFKAVNRFNLFNFYVVNTIIIPVLYPKTWKHRGISNLPRSQRCEVIEPGFDPGNLVPKAGL